jgi:hypothetical protein
MVNSSKTIKAVINKNDLNLCFKIHPPLLKKLLGLPGVSFNPKGNPAVFNKTLGFASLPHDRFAFITWHII